MVVEPSTTVLVSNETVNGVAVSTPTDAPLTKNSTWSTPLHGRKSRDHYTATTNRHQVVPPQQPRLWRSIPLNAQSVLLKRELPDSYSARRFTRAERFCRHWSAGWAHFPSPRGKVVSPVRRERKGRTVTHRSPRLVRRLVGAALRGPQRRADAPSTVLS